MPSKKRSTLSSRLLTNVLTRLRKRTEEARTRLDAYDTRPDHAEALLTYSSYASSSSALCIPWMVESKGFCEWKNRKAEVSAGRRRRI
eukprot:140089-Pyramimonas_sp.AAC.1